MHKIMPTCAGNGVTGSHLVLALGTTCQLPYWGKSIRRIIIHHSAAPTSAQEVGLQSLEPSVPLGGQWR